MTIIGSGESYSDICAEGHLALVAVSECGQPDVFSAFVAGRWVGVAQERAIGRDLAGACRALENARHWTKLALGLAETVEAS